MHYFLAMPKTAVVQIRLTGPEKEGIETAASLAGISLSAWIRERLRLAAIRELEGAGLRIPFIPQVPFRGSTHG
jgi:hypothetical protein